MSIKLITLDGRNKNAIQGITAAFLEGECYAFAIALHRDLGWPMVGLMEKGTVWHAAVRDPEGNLWDARGRVSKEEFGGPFGFGPLFNLKTITEKDLFDIRPVTDISICRASKTAQTLWPDLPWKPHTLRCRVLSFAEELEAVSRKHGFWIRSMFQGYRPVIAEGDGDESGYQLEMTLDGGYAIDRSYS